MKKKISHFSSIVGFFISEKFYSRKQQNKNYSIYSQYVNLFVIIITYEKWIKSSYKNLKQSFNHQNFNGVLRIHVYKIWTDFTFPLVLKHFFYLSIKNKQNSHKMRFRILKNKTIHANECKKLRELTTHTNSHVSKNHSSKNALIFLTE